MFKQIKNKVKKIIDSNNNIEVKYNTNNKDKGIYMLYIDNFDDDKIIPIYIGQTGSGENRNFQLRYKEHFQEIMALNRLQYEYYKNLLLERFYDGHYKACKIFQYMVNHNCTLKDFHMIVLETVDSDIENIQEVLDREEQKYFAEFLPAFFGFNQINSVFLRNKEFFENSKGQKELGLLMNLILFEPSEKLLKYELEDCENFIKYFGYGYTKFNYYHTYPKTYMVKENDNKYAYELRDKKEFLKNKYYDENKFKEYDDKLKVFKKKYEKNNENLKNNKDLFTRLFQPKIEEYCEKNKISQIHKYQDIVDIVIYQNKEKYDSFEKYLKRKKIIENIAEEFNQNTEFIDWRKKYINLERKNRELESKIKEYSHIRITDDLMRILPKKEYSVLPLQDNYKEIEFEELHSNEITINFEFSNHGFTKGWLDWFDFSYSLIKMDYKLKILDNIIEKRNIFILSPYDENSIEKNYFELDDMQYYTMRKREPFRVRRYPDYISTTMELQNGINDFTLMNKEKYDFRQILDEINNYINIATKVNVKVRNQMKKKCKEYIKANYEKDNLVKRRIIQSLNNS